MTYRFATILSNLGGPLIDHIRQCMLYMSFYGNFLKMSHSDSAGFMEDIKSSMTANKLETTL